MLDSDDARVYAKAVVELLRDPAKRRAMSEQGQQRVRRYDVMQTTPQLAALYEALGRRSFGSYHPAPAGWPRSGFRPTGARKGTTGDARGAP